MQPYAPPAETGSLGPRPWRTALWLIALSMSVYGAAIALHVWFQSAPYDLRPVPWLDSVPFVLLAVAALPFGALIWKTFRHRRARAKRTNRMLLGILAAHLVSGLAGSLGVVASDPDFLFGDTLLDSTTLPDDRALYLYRGGLFCSYRVYVAMPGDLWAYLLHSFDQDDCTKAATFGNKDGEVVVLGPDGELLQDLEGMADVLLKFLP